MEIKHDKEAQKFYLIKDGKESYVRYNFKSKNIINLLYTFVPTEQRNQGLAAKVTKAALNFARENNLRVIPTCSYTEYFIERNKEYESLL